MKYSYNLFLFVKWQSYAAFNFPYMTWNCILECTKVIIGFIFYSYISFTLICIVIFLQPFHAGFIFLSFSSCFLWKMEPVCSVYTAGWKTRPPDCKYKHRAGFFRPVHSHSYHRRAIKVLEEISIPPKTRHFFFFILLLFVLHWSWALVLWGFGGCLCMVYFYGAAIWRLSKCQGHLSCSSSAPWLLCGEKERHRPILHFMTYCVKWVPRQTGGSPDVSSSSTRLTKLEAPRPIL